MPVEKKKINVINLRRKACKKLRRKIQAIRRNTRLWIDNLLPIGTKIFIIGTPSHTNCGDSAIALAEKWFTQKVTRRKPWVKEITVSEFETISKSNIFRFMNSAHNHFFWHGGGNMGDQWFNEELFRQKHLVGQLNRRPIVFPQTFYYSDTEAGRQKLKNSISVYDNPNLTIVAREKQSFDLMRKAYPRADILLTPDIVLSTTMQDYGAVSVERSGVLFVTRSDLEKAVPDTTWEYLEAAARKAGKECRRSDMYSDIPVTKENRADCVRKKMQEFCGAELVITDRLHGMVFAALTGTPCIAFSNYNHKVKGTYDWISYLPYIRYVESVEEAEKAIPELLAMKDCKFDNKPLMPHFEKLAEVIRSHAAN